MTQGSRKNLLRVGILAVALLGLAAQWLLPSRDLATLATLLMVCALLLLMKQAAKWQLFQLSPSFPIRIPQVKAEWDGRAIVIGLLCFPAAILWGECIVLGVRFHILDNVSMTAAWLLLSPSGALILVGVFFMAKGIFVGARR